jgi:GH24 family phage-related lysozyme (muramidase)
MKVLITEDQYISIQSKLIYEQVLDDLVFKLSLISEDDGKTEPDMEWDFTDVKKDIDKSKNWVKTKEDAKEFLNTLSNKIKNLPSKVKRKIFQYVIFSLVGLLSVGQIKNYLDPPVEKAIEFEKEVLTKPIQDLKIRKSSKDLYNHLKWEEGSLKHKGEPVLVAYNLGDRAKTIGYGHAVFKREKEGYDFLPNYNKIISGKTKITKDQAEMLLKDDIKEAESIINKILDDWEEKGIKPQITQGMYDAMVSITFNMGPGIRTSNFIQLLKKGDIEGAKKEILVTSENLFDNYPGLKPRREREYKMFA